jgi:hypothetical protein
MCIDRHTDVTKLIDVFEQPFIANLPKMNPGVMKVVA